MRLLAAFLLLIPLTACQMTQARHFNDHVVEAEVLTVETIQERYLSQQPFRSYRQQTVCEPVRERHTYRDRQQSRNGAVVGALIGGLVGNQIGRGRSSGSRDRATISGALIGGSLGYQTGRHHEYSYGERCRTVNHAVTEYEPTTSYRTKYRVVYAVYDDTYVAVLTYYPGSSILVRVTNSGLVLGPTHY